MSIIKCYSELILLPTFKERYEYLRLNGVVGKETFGFIRSFIVPQNGGVSEILLSQEITAVTSASSEERFMER